MLLAIRHRTEYRYDAPVRESVMELWAQPRQCVRQRLLDFAIELEPAAQLFSYADSFGNAVYHFDVPQPHRRLVIHASATVESAAGAPLPERLEKAEWARLAAGAVLDQHFDFLQPHGLVAPTRALQQFVRSRQLEALRADDPLTAIRTLSSRLYEAFEYEPGVTEADSPIDHALESGRGVCQDFAHVMIAICRPWGLPARYVSGYLFTDAAGGDRSNPEATHAWVEVFLPSLGWVGLDPTNNAVAGERHIAVATGRDYADVPPSRGVYKGQAESELEVRVSVRKASGGGVEVGRALRLATIGSGRRPARIARLGEA
ncbi:MAG TPA: transglutaminase family protein [Caulobacteraceae bacterium]|nr:transglutaminase family protein [Caulobacteraceae bacterium]